MVRIESVLVANRGEIAVRIFRTCRRLGIRTVAVYSDADARALHVASADEAYRIGRPPASESYLNQRAILEAAERSRATAIHPGYGFLAENPEFAQTVIDSGLIWIGPPPAAMRALGDKARAKVLAEQHGVPLLAGYHADDQSPQALRERATAIGYPLLIKASAGGGGRGMRVVEGEPDFLEQLQAARREALASFGDERVLLERYLRRPRHIEIQILGDRHGGLVHLGERECSVQRRHQKLIEESPSPAVDTDLRAQMGEAALRLARAVGYYNAGTVEFLLDANGEFAFLEVNARLQVEHPVTEAVTGVDMVEAQLGVAAGEPLPLTQADVRFDGHAIEARVIAEDPLAGWAPSIGTVQRFDIPAGVRVDTGFDEGARVSPYYDSLLAKVIAHGPTRAAALLRLANALRTTRLEGVKTNIDLLLATVEHPAFRSGNLHTSFLDEHHVLQDLATLPPEVLAAVSAIDFLTPRRDADPWRGSSGWRLGRIDEPASWTRAGIVHDALVSSDHRDDGVEVDTGDRCARVRLARGEEDVPLSLRVDRGQVIVHAVERDFRILEWHEQSYRLSRTPAPSVEETVANRGMGGGSGQLSAPMPGRVVKVGVEAGQRVDQSQPLLVLEAMKMEHVVEAPHAGVVTEVCVDVGQQVAAGTRLLVMGSDDQAPDVE
jgi:3-methylcrotonyl-CoA carboxylase alpha subunit